MTAPSAAPADAPRARVAPWIQPLWAVCAAVASLCGIGGGLFAVPLLHYVAGLPLKRAVATSLCLVFTLSVTATTVELLHAGSALRGGVVAALIAGGFVGARLGLRVAARIDVRALKALFVVVLALAAARILGLSAFVGEGGAGLELAGTDVAVVLAVGFGGGFVAPLLGVGGGLLVIPALFLSLPTISYLEARACSLAMTIFVSGLSARAYWRRGDIERGQVGGLVVATVVGSLAGVLAVHREGWAEVARTAMGVVLALVAVRFLVDVVRARRA